MRRHLLLPSIIAAALVTGGIGSITAARADSDGTLRATTTPAAPTEAYDITAAGCTHQDPTTKLCAIPVYETNNYTGDLVGQDQIAGAILATVPDFVGQAVTVAIYSGTVKGCPGPGTAIFRTVDALGPKTPGINQGTIEVVPGSGTGGLSKLGGHGSLTADARSGSVTSTLRLDFSCTNRHDD